MCADSRLFADCLTEDPAASRLTLLGLCDDSQSSYLSGAARAPERVRHAYHGDCYNSATEWGQDLAGKVHDAGDLLPEATWEKTSHRFQKGVSELLEENRIPCVLGGDHAVTVPCVSAFENRERPIHVLQFDAHPDLYPEFDGNPHSHACTGARLLEMRHVTTLTQIGVRAINPVQQETARKHAGRLFCYPAASGFDDATALPHIPSRAPIYITLDVDVFDPAFAPGVSHPVPGGLFPRELLNFLAPPFLWRLVGIDIVEVNPDRDVQDRTAILAARLLHHAMALGL